jgi:type IV pilus assembly protein PilY1
LATWVKNNASLAGYTITNPSNGTVTIRANSAVASTYDISSIVVTSATLPTVPYTTTLVSGAGVAPSNGTLVISGVTAKSTNTSIKCGTAFIGTAAAYSSINSNTASTRLTDLYTKINGTTVNGYSIACDKPSAPMTCTITPPGGASACPGGFTLVNISTSTNTGPSGGSGTATAASGSITFTNASMNATGFSIKVNGTEILTSTAPGSMNATALATWVAGNSTLAGYTITNPSAGKVTITAKRPVATTYNISSIVVSSASTVGNDTSFSTPVAGVTAVTAVTARPAVIEVLARAATDYGRFVRTDIVSTNPATTYAYPGKATRADSRTDCAGTTTCTYAEEMTNFANWWTYYHTRMQSMKTSVSRAFKTLDNRYRVGFTTISDTGASNGTGFNNATFLGNDTFELTHKNRWFTKLFGAPTASATPLRGAISKAGRYYGNKITGEVDPVQYSCQQNFTILSTDGYWNVNDESPSANNNSSGACTNNNAPTTNYGAYGLDNKTCVGNLDGVGTARPMYDGSTTGTQIPNSLADVAKYYYDTDLRTGTANTAACMGAVSPDFPSGNPDVCFNNVFISPADNNVQQHMTTFTMGLGADGLLNYTSDYATAKSGDFYNLTKGINSTNWPNPIANSGPERIDDLWHAAVNGSGNYFSAKNPNQILSGFKAALSSIEAKLGSAAAAATSTLNPVAGNNFAYVASYTTVKWVGNLEARSIDTTNGAVSTSASWCVEDIPSGKCPTPLVPDTSGNSTVYNCVIPNGTSSACTAPAVAVAGTVTTTNSVTTTNYNCVTQMANICTGTMSSKLNPTDTRSIYTAPAGNLTPLTSTATGLSLNLVPFDAAYATANPTNFAASHINTLTQWNALSTTQQTAAAGINLINYLRGQNGFEDRTSNTPDNRLYRLREAVLGDALESQPAYNSIPVFNYPYPGYSTFKSNHASRFGTVYMGTNDGMLHAFAGKDETVTFGTNETGGTERWAYVPSMVIPNMWKLASSTYENNHINFVNGSPIISDVCTAYCADAATAVWRTILVGGLNGGGRGYYALDITEPNVPVLLWEFTPSCVSTTTAVCTGTVQDDDLGFSFGHPVITRKADGAWVVLVTSGYNNVNPGTGGGYLYVLEAGTGNILSKLSTGVGNTSTPSGLAEIATWNDEPAGNKAGFTYGGDLLGNVWRFDVNTGAVMLFATLADSSSVPQPVTTPPVLGTVAGNRVLFIGTGKYLEKADVSNTQQQSLYAIKDNNVTTTFINPRSFTKGGSTASGLMVNQTITQTGSTRTGTNAKVDFTIDRGWYLDFPDGGGSTGNGAERVNIDGRLVLGTLIMPTIVPSSSICSPGGYGWLNFFNYENGNPTNSPLTSSSSLNKNVSMKYDSAIVGINVIYIAGKPVVEVVTSSNPTPTIEKGVVFTGPAGGFKSKRVLWREFIQ